MLKNVTNRHDDPLTKMGWQDFERLLAEYYREQGFRVEHCGTGNNRKRYDGGVDLKLFKDEQVVLVQCKHWNAKQVPHNDVHQLIGVMVNESATGAILISSGEFTAAAKSAATKQGHVQLIDGTALRNMLGSRLDALGSGTSTEVLPRANFSLKGKSRRTYRKAVSGAELLGRIAIMIVVLVIAFGILRSASNKLQTQLNNRSSAAPVGKPAVVKAIEATPDQGKPKSEVVNRPAASIQSSDQMNKQELDDWKKKNAESMKLLEKTTPELKN